MFDVNRRIRDGYMVLEIATPCGLAMTVGDEGWFLCAGMRQSSMACTAERHGGRSLQRKKSPDSEESEGVN